MQRLRSAHAKICEILAPLTFEIGSLEGVISSRQPINGALNHSSVMAYGHAFRLGAIRGIVDKIFYDVQQVLAEKQTFLHDVEQLNSTIVAGLECADENGSFAYYDFLVPFLTQVKKGLDRFIASTRGRFVAKITLAIPEHEPLPKRYPLHESGRMIRVRSSQCGIPGQG